MLEFPERMRISDSTEVKTAIPSWHINGHGSSCRTKFCLGYTKGVGRTCGEEVEITWSHTNPLASSVREMATAARRDTLNDHWNGWNFRKRAGFGKDSFSFFRMGGLAYTFNFSGPSFARKFKEAVQMQANHQDLHDQFTATFQASHIKQWTTAIEKWENDPKQPNPYEEPDNGKCCFFNRMPT